MSRPYLMGALVGGLAAWLVRRARHRPGFVSAAPHTVKPIRKANRRRLPGEPRQVPGS